MPVAEALLSVIAEGLLAGPVCGLFVGRNPLGPADAVLMAEQGAHAVYDLPPGDLDSFVAKITAVDKAQIRQTARKYFRPDNLTIVVVGDRTSNEAALRKIADLEIRDLDGNVIEPGK